MAKKSNNLLSGIKEIIKNRFIRFFPIAENKNSVHKFSKKISRTYLTKNETLQLNGKTKLKAAEINQDAKAIFKELFRNPEDLLRHIESQDTLVIKAPHIEKVLILLGEEEGFILPLSGIRALILTVAINLLSDKKVEIGFNSPAMFAMRNQSINIYYLAHQFHHWLSYNRGLPGYDEETSINFKSIFSPDFGSNDIRAMSIDEILSLKEAIARDFEAIRFVKEISRELIGSRNSVNRLKNGESISL